MKKVLIADDELVVRIGLKTTINWEENGFTIVGEATNGKDAVDLFHKLQPDILVTDIKMPLMDGLEVIQQLKAEQYPFKALILSHYDDFDYARKAINLGASDYILKTELTEHKLLKVLRQLSDQLDEEQKLNKFHRPQTQEMAPHFNIAQQVGFLKCIIEGKLKADGINDYLSSHPRIFESSEFLAACVNIEKSADSNQDLESNQFYSALDDISSNFLGRKNWRHAIVPTVSNIYYLVNFPADSNHDKATIQETFETLKRNIEQFLNIQVSIGISLPVSSPAQIPEILQQAKSAWLSCYFEPGNSVKIANATDRAVITQCPALDTDYIRKGIGLNAIEQVHDHIDMVFDSIREANNFDYVREVFNDAISLAKMLVAERRIANSTTLSDDKFSYRNFDRLSKFEEVRKYIQDLYSQISVNKIEKSPDQYSYSITRCIKFIKHNYQNPISLTDAADYVGISKCYLSLLFRQETGVNFSAWLASYRVEKAKLLLADSNMKLYEIAEMVGFDNPYYFSKVFKDIAGESCKDYKNRCNSQAVKD